jgi:hypothetical protein
LPFSQPTLSCQKRKLTSPVQLLLPSIPNNHKTFPFFLNFLCDIMCLGALVDKKGRGRWVQYQTALSNTGPLLLLLTTTTTPPTTTPTARVRGSSGNMNTYNHNRANYFGGMVRKVRYEGVIKGQEGGLFENNTVVNMTVPLGDTAFLVCSAKNLGERSVSELLSYILTLIELEKRHET